MMNNETVPSSHYEAAEALQDISNTRYETPVQKKRKKRTLEDVQSILPMLKEHKFFKERQQIDETLLARII